MRTRTSPLYVTLTCQAAAIACAESGADLDKRLLSNARPAETEILRRIERSPADIVHVYHYSDGTRTIISGYSPCADEHGYHDIGSCVGLA